MFRRLSFLLLIFVFNPAHSATLMILGDSLSAGYQMPITQAWPTLLPNELKQQGKDINVINASISGDTTGNGLARLPNLLAQHRPDYVLIELGANDGLRGFPPKLIENNLTQMISMIRESNAKPLLMQIHVLPNYGKRYTEAFSSTFPNVSTSQEVPLLPFFLEGVIIKPEWMMDDGLHPKSDAQPWIANFVAGELINHL
ncbi:multifunctional acyl-CoA thioesterase I/protease I/lysophospholipase L1 [Vibrio sp. RE86]|uniref:multifunctional acyl-CoA thioesterase I/protease I/lysophospholipase L1 n=1 Tax=Vibrio sp. RE86 TaxID=2607605 RepID=UPI0014936B14|nr:multifunctional acyl-CoA thioesterase I/protease I/lysophospholipase L1 [Vibrio sp. RE86]NOH81074.1 multifunctional acyl-CoA thioesterase I/protease I/lysophospholipase L1 [Vibrio sp. RE86]